MTNMQAGFKLQNINTRLHLFYKRIIVESKQNLIVDPSDFHVDQIKKRLKIQSINKGQIRHFEEPREFMFL